MQTPSKLIHRPLLLIIVASIAWTSACGLKGERAHVATSRAQGNVGASAPPLFGHVFIVLEENQDSANVLGAGMPYLTRLAGTYGTATQYYADTHPSIGNYEMLVTGQVLTNDDNQTPQSFPISVDNVVRELVAAGKTWKSYAEDVPSVGYTGGDFANYAVRHNPFPYLTDVQNDPVQVMNLAPFSDLAADLAAGTLPDYAFIVPNLCDDAHDCSVATADSWLQANIDPLIQSPVFQRDGLLIITFDESESDNTLGGGQVAFVVVSPFAKPGYQSTTVYQHESTLRLSLEGLGVTQLPGGAASAPQMGEFFTASPPPPSPDAGVLDDAASADSSVPSMPHDCGGASAATDSGVPPSSSDAGAEPLAIQGQGYHVALVDDFDTLDISPDGTGSHTWYNGLWWTSSPAPLSQASVNASVLSLTWQQGQSVADTSIETFGLGGSSSHTFRYGYFEARMRWNPVVGAWPAFWLIPVEGAQGATDTGELDIFEGQGDSPSTFFGTLHEWVNNSDVWNTGGSNAFPLPNGADYAQFHTYAALWTPGDVTWYFDDVPLHSEATRAIFDAQSFFLVLSMQEGAGWNAGDLTGVSDSMMALDVDWVRVWQR
jgi:acid phosphatase